MKRLLLSLSMLMFVGATPINNAKFYGNATFQPGSTIDFTGATALNLTIPGLSLPSQAGHTGQFLITDGINASWDIVSFTSLGRKPTTLSGYGITDGQPLNPNLISISALSTTSFGRGALTQADAASFRTYIGTGTSTFSGNFSDLNFAGSNLTQLSTRNFSDLQSKPTTLSGYGITDSVHNVGDETVQGVKTFTSVPSLPVQAANFVLAGSISAGPMTVPAFRLLSRADIPSLLFSNLDFTNSNLSTILGTTTARGLLNEKWIAARNPTGCGSDGMTGCAGTEEDPYDGGTQAKLDAIMPTIPTGTNIQFDGGTFTTNGILVLEGWRIHGRGKDLTTIKLANSAPYASGSTQVIFYSTAVFTGTGFLNYAEITDMTLDDNAANQPNYTGNLTGYIELADIGAKGCRFINLRGLTPYAKPGEGFPLHIEHDGSTGNADFSEITNCEVINPTGYLTAIIIFDQRGGLTAGIIRDCLVSNSGATSLSQGYGARGVKNFKFDKNTCRGVSYGMVMDTGDFTNVEVGRQYFEVVQAGGGSGGNGIFVNGTGVYTGMWFHDNYVSTDAAGDGRCFQTHATGTFGGTLNNNTFVQNNAHTATLLGTGASGIYSGNTVTETVVSTFPSTVSLGLNTNASGTPIYSNTSPNNFSTTSQSPAAATRTYITGSKIAVPIGKLKIGTMFHWTFNMTKTAAGTAASTIDIAVGTAGTTADTARVSFTKPAGTAAADEGMVTIDAIVRGPLSASGVLVGEFVMTHNGNTVGHATIPVVVVNTVSGAFDVTVANLFVGLCVTSGASDAITIQQVTAQSWNL